MAQAMLQRAMCETSELPVRVIGGLELYHVPSDSQAVIYNEDACRFVCDLVREFGPRIRGLLRDRVQRQREIDAGKLPDFRPETQVIRDSDWKIAGIPADLLDRGVELSVPPERKALLKALNANVRVLVADFEDSLSPAWEAIAQAQVNLHDAVNKTLGGDSSSDNRLNPKPPVLICRTRGLHLTEKHICLNGAPLPASLVDFGFYFYHNAHALLAQGSGPYFCLPKLQVTEEAAWWSDLFRYAESRIGLRAGTIKATVSIETLPAVFEMDEILYAMRDHIVALDCDRWDYLFSYIKTLKKYPDRVLPDRHMLTMDTPFLQAYTNLLVKTCHKRGAQAIAGASAFDSHCDEGGQNRLDLPAINEAEITAQLLISPCQGEQTERGLRTNLRIALLYIEAWLNGNACVGVSGLLEDTASAETSRSLIWQWIHHGQLLSNGKRVSKALVREYLDEELDALREELGEGRYRNGRFADAAKLLDKLTTADEYIDFLTIPAYTCL